MTVDAAPGRANMNVPTVVILDVVFVMGSLLSGFATYWNILLAAAIPWTAAVIALDPFVKVERFVFRPPTVCITTKSGKAYVMPRCDSVKVKRSKRFGLHTIVSFRYHGRYWTLPFLFGSRIDFEHTTK